MINLIITTLKTTIIMFIGTLIAPFEFKKWNLQIKSDSEDPNLYWLCIGDDIIAGFEGSYLVAHKAAICFVMSQLDWAVAFLGY